MVHLDDHIAAVRDQLTAAAALGDQHTRDVAGALGNALTPALRLAITGAVSEAADEVTAALLDHPGSPAVTAQLDGPDLRIEVRNTDYSGAGDSAPTSEEGDANARISLRLAESLKAEIEAAARAEGVSVNTWLVRAAGRSLRMTGPAAAVHDVVNDALRRANNAHKITGWING